MAGGSLRINKTNAYDMLIKMMLLILVILVFAFNDHKEIMYPYKIFYIFVTGLLMVFRRKNVKWYMIWTILFLIWCLASILWAENPDNVIYQFQWVFQAFLIFAFTVPLIDSKDKLDFLLKCFIVGAIFLSVRLILFTPAELWGLNRIGSAIGYNPNVIGVQMVVAILSCIYFFSESKYKAIIVIMMISFGSIILFSGSRKSFLALIIGIITYLIFNNKKRGKIIFVIPILLGLVYGSVYLVHNVELFYNVIGYRLDTLFNLFLGEGDNVRLHMISQGMELFRNKPILGYGIGSYSTISGFETYSHNNYVEMLVNLGLIGFSIYYSMYVFIIYKLLRLRKYALPATSLYLSFMISIAFLEVGVVSYRDLHILLVIAACYVYTMIYNNYSQKVVKEDG